MATHEGNVTEVYYHPSVGIKQASLGRIVGVTRISSFYADEDSYFNRRVVATTIGGQVIEIRYSPRGGIMRSARMNTSNLMDVGSSYTPDDKYRHIITALNNGDIRETYYYP